jgi:hypothetical protein
LPINISREGGQQVNVQGDVNGQKATPPRLTAMKPTQPTLGRPDQPPPFRPACLGTLPVHQTAPTLKRRVRRAGFDLFWLKGEPTGPAHEKGAAG